MLPGVSPAERHALYVAMVTTMVQLHVIDWRDAGLRGFGGKGGDDYAQRQVFVDLMTLYLYLFADSAFLPPLPPPQVSVWSNNYRKAVLAGEKADEEMEQLMEWLSKNTPTGTQPSCESNHTP